MKHTLLAHHPHNIQNYLGNIQNYPGNIQNYPGNIQNYPGNIQNYPGNPTLSGNLGLPLNVGLLYLGSNTFPCFCRVPQSKFEANRSRGS